MNIQKHYWKWLIAAVGYVGLFALHYFSLPKNDTEQVTAKLQETILEKIADVKKDYKLFLLENQFPTNAKEIPTAIYKNDSLIFWNNNHSIITEETNIYKDGITYQHLLNGDFVMCKFYDSTHHTIYLSLIPIRYDYSIKNIFLENKWLTADLENFSFIVSATKIENGFEIKDENNSPLFYLHSEVKAEKNHSPQITWWQTIAFIFLLYFFFFGINDWCRFVQLKWGKVFEIAMLLSAGVLLYYTIVILKIPCFIADSKVFAPEIYASAKLFTSLGQLMVFIMILTWILFYYFYFIKDIFSDNPDKRVFIFSVIIAIILLSLLSLGTLMLFASLILDSNITFSIYQIQDFSGYTFLGFLAFALLILCLFLMGKTIIKKWQNRNFGFGGFFAITIIFCFPMFFLVNYLFNTNLDLKWFLMMKLFFVMMYFLYKWLNKKYKLFFYFISMFVMALAGGFFINMLSEQKEHDNRIHYAIKLNQEQDPITEALFIELQEHLQQDKFIQYFAQNSWLGKQQIINRIRQKYFLGYFNKYDLAIKIFSPQEKLLAGDADQFSKNSLDSLISNFGQSTRSPFLFYVQNNTELNYYAAKVPVFDSTQQLATIYLLFIPTPLNKGNVYPELLLEDKMRPQAADEYYDFAIYKHNQLLRQSGDYPYSTVFDKAYFKNKEFSFLDSKRFSHLIYNAAGGNTIIVSMENRNAFSIISLTCCLLITILLSLLVLINLFKPQPILFYIRHLSIANRVLLAIATVILIVFTIIGGLMVVYYKNEFNNSIKEKLTQRINTINKELEQHFYESKLIDGDKSVEVNLSNKIQELSTIYETDLNVYDFKGRLVATSQPLIFEKGIIATQINPEAFESIISNHNALLIQNERIGNLNYLSAYAPVKIGSTSVNYLINIPNFSNEKELNLHMSTFLLVLANMYVIFVLIALMLSYLLSGSITRSFTMIGNKMKAVKLGGGNEIIEWHQDDEVGQLVKEYNRMILKLDESAVLLGKSERESAWREMSQQVAHEIKNPLTPMKLSLQLLQRAIKDNRTDINELTQKVSATLVEQIDNLAHIATQFSQFAKISQVNASVNDLNKIIQSVVELYEQNSSDVQIHFQPNPSPLNVLVDKNQFVSVFNNLVLNAIQSIPESEKGEVMIQTLLTENKITITIKDNGSGIEADKLEKIFEPNFTTKSSGTGLGLAISKTIVENAGGKITVNSSVGEGSTFVMELESI